MKHSKYNLITDIEGINFTVFNPLSGAFDVADKQSIERFKKLEPQNEDEYNYWLKRGFVFENELQEDEFIGKKNTEFNNEMNKSDTQFLIVPTYNCNFNCSYCYQKGIENTNLMTKPMIDNIIKYLIKYREQVKPEFFVTIFGGEPLLDSPKQADLIRYLASKLIENNIYYAVVTNGYEILKFKDILVNNFVREVHITLDGDEQIHNKRRYTKNDNNSFARIIDGMKYLTDNFIQVNLRIIIDKQTMPTLPGLAEKLDNAGLLKKNKMIFKTSLGRNYELIDPHSGEELLYELDEMYREFVKLMDKYPLVAQMHTPSFFGIKNIVEKKEAYLPSFDTCPAGKSEFVFDWSGNIYGCTASCGREGYEFGKFYPEVEFYTDKMKDWTQRSILTIPGCSDCSVALLCGGGCGVIANDRNGTPLSKNCKPVKEVVDIGIKYFKSKIL